MRKWLLLAILLVAVPVRLFCLRWLPDPPIVISKETTYITEPLDEDGLPDYVEYLRQRCREGVTPENNAAVLIARAIGPAIAPLDEDKYWYASLGIEMPPEEGVYFSDELISEAGDIWLFEQWQLLSKNAETTQQRHDVLPWVRQTLSNSSYNDPNWEGNIDSGLIESLKDRLYDRPWSRDIGPPLAAALGRQEAALDLLHGADSRTHFFEPILGVSIISCDYPVSMATLGLSRGLAMRAMLHLGEGRREAAWRDISCIYDLGRHIGRNPKSLVQALIGHATEEIAHDASLAFLTHAGTDIASVRQSLRELQELDRWQAIPFAMQYERLIGPDVTVGLSKLGANYNHLSDINGVSEPTSWDRLKTPSVDWNVVLRQVNQSYDEVVAALKESNHIKRLTLNKQIEKQTGSG